MASHKEERRQAPRLKLFQPAEMRSRGDESRVHLLNLSTSGALVYGEKVPALGEEVQLRCSLPLGPGRVAWVEGRRFGVAFRQTLSDAVVEQVLEIQDALIVSASARLGVPCRKVAVPA